MALTDITRAAWTRMISQMEISELNDFVTDIDPEAGRIVMDELHGRALDEDDDRFLAEFAARERRLHEERLEAARLFALGWD